MAQLLLKTRLAIELPKINAALSRVLATLPGHVQPICRHVFDAGGKRLRPFLLILTANLFGYADRKVYDLAVSLEMLHAATLLHDDVIDNAATRRGSPAAHRVFSPTTVILAGDALLACGNTCVSSFCSSALSIAYATAIAETCDGEIAEIEHQYACDTSAETYLAIIQGKTAKLIRTSCEMGALLAGADEASVRACAEFGENIGIAFQLVDDALDFADEKETGKPCGGDIREGKLTMPLRWYREDLSEPDRAVFDAGFSQGSFSLEDCQAIARSVREKGFDKKTRQFADTYLARAEQALAVLPDRSERTLLQSMTAYVRDRKK